MKIGFIGGGNIAKSIIGGIISSNLYDSEDIIVSSKTLATRERLRDEFKLGLRDKNSLVASEADILFLTVKPNIYEEVITEVRDYIKEDVIVVLVAAGKTITWAKDKFNRDIKIVKSMPNTPALVGQAMTGIAFSDNLTDKDQSIILDIFNSFGRSEVVDESLMDVVTGVSGSSPAYIYMIIEAMADCAVLRGMKRDQAYNFAAQSVMGAAKMVLDTGDHPGVLKDRVCSPVGTTIEAVAKLEELGLRSAMIQAMNACIDKSIEMTKQ